MPAADTENRPVATRALGRQFIFNSLATLALYTISLFVGLWYPPFTVNNLGISLQAVVQLAAGLIVYMAFVTGGISSSVGRFVMADVARGDIEAANRTFNTYLVAAERAILVLIAVIGVVVVFVVPTLNYPPGLLNVTRFVFASVLSTVIVQLLCVCFDSAIWVSGRIDIRSAINTVEILVRTLTVFVLFKTGTPSLVHIGIANIAAPLTSLGLYLIAFKKLTPELKIDRKLFSRERFREITGQGGWVLVFQAGTALQFNADIFVLNKLLGPQIQGSYGLLLTWCGILRGLLGSMGQLLSSSLAAFQASEDEERVAHLARKGVRIQGLLMAIPIGILCGLAAPALNWWMRSKGAEFMFLAPLSWLILVPLAIEGSFNPALILLLAPKAIPFPSKAAVALGVLNVALGILLVKYTSMGMYGVGLALAITSALRHGVVFPMYAARIMGRPWYFLIQQQAQVMIQLGVTGALALYASTFIHTKSLLDLALAAAAVGSVSALLALAQLQPDERARLFAVIRRR